MFRGPAASYRKDGENCKGCLSCGAFLRCLMPSLLMDNGEIKSVYAMRSRVKDSTLLEFVGPSVKQVVQGADDDKTQVVLCWVMTD